MTEHHFNTIRYELDDGVLTLTLARPERRNAFTWEMAHEYMAAFDLADADDSVRAIIVTGEGDCFSAGADLERKGDTFDQGELDADGQPPRDGGGLVSLRILASTKPVIGAINGPAVGMGVTTTLPMDIRLASDRARFGFVFSRRGVVLEAASSWFLPRVVGISRALEWAATGRVFDAAEARDAGLVREVYRPEGLLPAARRIAREIADNTAPVSVALNRRLLWHGLYADEPMQAHLAESWGMFLRGKSADVHEGVSAFLEKRPPNFSDRVSAGLPDLSAQRPVNA